jgi:hypothetical protein
LARWGFSELKEVDKLHALDLFVMRSLSVFGRSIAHKAVRAVILNRSVTGPYAAYSGLVGVAFQSCKWAMRLIDNLQCPSRRGRIKTVEPGRFNSIIAARSLSELSAAEPMS